MTNAAKGQSKPSKEQAANFHVLPKDGKKDKNRVGDDNVGNARIEDRDADAGSLLGQQSNEVNQPLRDQQNDRSQVS